MVFSGIDYECVFSGASGQICRTEAFLLTFPSTRRKQVNTDKHLNNKHHKSHGNKSITHHMSIQRKQN